MQCELGEENILFNFILVMIVAYSYLLPSSLHFIECTNKVGDKIEGSEEVPVEITDDDLPKTSNKSADILVNLGPKWPSNLLKKSAVKSTSTGINKHNVDLIAW